VDDEPLDVMKRVLIVSPHFPPDSSAATHRARILAPHLPAHGWEPTIVTVDPRDYEGHLDPDLTALVPSSLRVVRVRAWAPRWTRKLGIGDLGLRALRGLSQECFALLQRERFDALYITIYPSYPAILGPRLKRRFGIPFVLDYQDPWVGAWGQTVGGGPDGRPDLRSRLTRRLSEYLEPRTVRHADAITAVSERTYEDVIDRNPALRNIPRLALPIGVEPSDYAAVRANRRSNQFFDPADGQFHLCYVGTLLPMGFETLRAVLGAIKQLRESQPRLYERLRVHFFGTSNQRARNSKPRVLPIAAELGVADRITEVPWRVDYIDALTIQTQASAILMMGSSERHYTASKLYPGLLAQRPILAVYHNESTVTSILRGLTSAAGIELVVSQRNRRAQYRRPR
jgi:glycosyltransferase involved in cell wall biosynthesis